MSARQGELEATSHATVKVSYKFSTSVKYYDEYTLQIANVPATAITDGAAIDWTKATLSDTTKVSLCQNDSKYNMPKKYQSSENTAGDYLVLVAEDGTIYGISDFTLYTEDATTPGNAVNGETTVNQDENDPFACGKHCDAYVENAEGVKLYCSSFDTCTVLQVSGSRATGLHVAPWCSATPIRPLTSTKPM